jgi:hypothetical protein
MPFPSSLTQTYTQHCPSGTGIAAIYTLTLIRTNVLFNEEQERISNSFFSCTLALNAVCTGASFSYICQWRMGLKFLRPTLAYQGLLRFAYGGLRSRQMTPVTPRWVLTLSRSPLLSLSLVRFISLLATTTAISHLCDRKQVRSI